MGTATFRFYEELNDFLASDRRGRDFSCTCARVATTKHMIEALGVSCNEKGTSSRCPLVRRRNSGSDHFQRRRREFLADLLARLRELRVGGKLLFQPMLDIGAVLAARELGLGLRRLLLLEDLVEVARRRIGVSRERGYREGNYCNKFACVHGVLLVGHGERAFDPFESDDSTRRL